MKIEVEVEIRWWGFGREEADIYLGNKIGLGRIFKNPNSMWQFYLFGKPSNTKEYDSVEEAIYGMFDTIGATNEV